MSIEPKNSANQANKLSSSPLSSRSLFHWAVLVIVFAVVVGAILVRKKNDKSYGLQSQAAEQTMAVNKIPQQTRLLLNLVEEMRHATVTEQPNLLNQAAEIAASRKKALNAAMSTDPGMVIRNTIPDSLRETFPPEVKNFLETTTTLQGKIRVTINESFDDTGKFSNARRTYSVADDKLGLVNLYFQSNPESLMTDEILQVSGTLLDGSLAISSDPNNTTVISAAAIPAGGQKKIAVITFGFESVQSGMTADITRGLIFTNVGTTNTGSVNQYYQEASYGQWGLTGALRADGDVFGLYTIPNSVVNYPNNLTCGTVGEGTAKQMAQTDGYVETNYDKTIYIFPTSVCGWAGSALVGGSVVNINSSNPTNNLIAHELGHTFGLEHANAYDCTDSGGNRVAISSNCSSAEYGDVFDLMGTDTGYFSDVRKGFLSWLSTANMQTASGTADYTIVPMEQASAALHSLRVPRADGKYYYVEYRQRFGFDLRPGGVLIRIAPDYSAMFGVKTNLIDNSPATTSRGDEALAIGQTFTDPANGVTVTTLSADSNGAVVRIATSNPITCTRQTPQVTIVPDNQNGTPGQTLGYKVTIRNRDNFDCTTATFSLTSTVPRGWAQTPSSFSETLTPGQSVTRDIYVTSPTGAINGNYTFSEKVSPGGKTSTTASATYTVKIVDTVPPTVTLTSPVDGSTVPTKGNGLKISATASDNIKVVKIDIRFDGALIASCSNTATCSYTLGFNNISPGNHTITAVAFDAANNTATASSMVTK